MVAYSFQERFIEPIEKGRKTQTIRAERKRHARVGEALQLYRGMRTRQCRLIGRATCSNLQPVQLGLRGGWVKAATWRLTGTTSLDSFARQDGFLDWFDMRTFWAVHHPDVQTFSGLLIRWEGFSLP